MVSRVSNMKNRQNRLSVMVLALFFMVAAILPARAHHSYANYNMSTLVQMEGTVRQVHWIFPHVTIYVEVEDAGGQAQMWAMGASTPAGVERAGVSRDDVQPGDRVGVRCYPIKDGSLGCALGFVTPMHGDMERGHGVELAWN